MFVKPMDEKNLGNSVEDPNPALPALLKYSPVKNIYNLHSPDLGAIHDPRHIKPQTRQTPDTSNLRHINPQTMNIGLPTTQQIDIPHHSSIEILFENLKINWIFTLSDSPISLSEV